MDIAELAFRVDTSDIKNAHTELDKLGKTGSKVEGQLTSSSRGLTSSFGGVGRSVNGVNLDKLARDADNARSAMDKTTRSGSGLTSVMGKLSGLVGGLGLAALATDAFNTYKSFESMKASLKTVTGSAEAAGAAFKDIQTFAKETPFTLDQSVQGFQKLKALGLDPSMEALRSYGNTSAAMGKDMMQMIEAVADASTGEFERLKEFGIKAKSEKDKVSFTFQGVTTTIGKNSEEIQKYLLDIGQTKFGTAMADQMDTAGGKISNLQDNITQLQLTFMEATGAGDAIKGAIGSLSGVVGDAVGWIKGLAVEWAFFKDDLQFSDDTLFVALRGIGDAVQRVGIVLAPVLPYLGEFAAWAAGSGAALGVATLAVGALAAGFAALTSPIALVVAAVAGVGMAASYIYDNWGGVSEWFAGVWSDMQSAGQNFIAWWNGTTLEQKTVDIATGAIELARTAATGFFSWWDDSTLKQHSPEIIVSGVEKARELSNRFFTWWDSYTLSEKITQIKTEALATAKSLSEEFTGWWNSTTLEQKVVDVSTAYLDTAKAAADAFINGWNNSVLAELVMPIDTSAAISKYNELKSIVTDSSIYQAAVSVWQSIGPGITSAISDIASGASRAWADISTGLSLAFGDVNLILGEFKQTFAVWASWFSGSTGTAMDDVVRAFGIGWDAIKTTVSIAWDVISGVIKTGWDAATGLITTGLRLLRGDFSGAWDSIIATAKGFVTNIIGVFDNIAPKLLEAGKNIVSGLAAGIKAGAGMAVDAAKNVGSSVVNSITGLFQIRSPSRLMAELGLHVSSGFAVGIDSGGSKIKTAAEKAAKSANDSFNSIVEGLEKQYLKLTQGDEAARRYELGMQGIVGANQNAVIAAESHIKTLQEQATASDESAKAATKNSEEQARAAKAVTDAVNGINEGIQKQIIKLTEGDNAARLYELGLQKITGSAADAIIKGEAYVKSLQAQADKANEAAKSAEDYKKTVDDMHQALDKQILSLTGSAEEISRNELELKKITGTEQDAILAKQEHIREIEAQQKIMKAGEAVFESTRTDAEKLTAETKRLKEIHEAGGIEADTYQRAIKSVRDQYDPAAKAAKEYADESQKLTDKIKVLEAGFGGNEEAARRAELELKNYNQAQIDGIIADENRIKTLEKTGKGFEDLAAQAKKTSESINQSLTEAFLSGDFKSIGSSLVDIFKNDIAKPILDNVFKPLSDAIGNSFSGIGNSISGALGQGSLFGTTGTGGGVLGMLSGGGWQGALMGGGLGMMAGQAFGQSGIGSGLGGAIGSIWGPVGTAIGAGLGGLVESLFSSGPQKIKGTFGSFGSVVQDQNFVSDKADRTFYQTGRSNQSFQRQSEFGQFGVLSQGSVSIGRDDPKQIEALHAALDAMQALDTVIASFLPASTIDRIKTNLDGLESNALNTEQVTKQRLSEIFKGMDAELRRAFQGGQNVISGTAEEIAARFAYIAQINDVQFVPAMEKMGWNLGSTETKALAAAVGLTDAAGGLDQLKSGLESYYQVVFTAAERQAMEQDTARAAIEVFNAANNAQITSLESFKNYVEGLNKQTTAGQEATAAALELTGSIATLYGTADDAAGAVDNASDALDNVADSANAVSTAYENAIQAERDRAYEIKHGTDALRQRQLAEAGWTQQMIDDLYSLKSANDQAETAANQVTSSLTQQTNSTNDLAIAANNAVYDVSALKNSISGLVSQLYGSSASGTSEIDAAQAQLTNLQNQYSAEQERIAGLNEAAQAAYIAEVERINALNSAANDAYNADLDRVRDLNAANDEAYRAQSAQHESLKNAAYDLRGFIDDFRGTMDTGDTVDNLHELQKQFNAAANLAASGDLDAAQEVQGLAGSLRGLYSEVFGSGTATAQLADNQILVKLESVANALDAAAGNQPIEPTVINDPSRPTDISLPTRPADIESTVLASLQSQIAAQQNLIASLSAANETAETEANRQALALELATRIGELGLALDESVFDLLRENGIAIADLAADFGVDVTALRQSVESIGTSITGSITAQTDSAALIPYLTAIESANDTGELRTAVYDLLSSNGQALTDLKTAFNVDISRLNADTISNFDALADSLHIDTITLSGLLGADFDDLKAAIAGNLSALPDLSNDIKAGLAPYLSAIETANDTAALQSALVSLQAHVDSLPPGIKSQLNTQLQGIVGNTSGTISAIGAMNNENLAALDALADALQTDTVSLAAELGADLDILGNQIAAQLSTQTTSLPVDIRDGLAPYLAAIEGSNDTTSLKIAIAALEGHIDGLPPNIKSQLDAQLSGIVGNTSGITDSLFELIASNSDALETVASSFGVDVSVLNQSVKNIGASITGSIVAQTDSTALIPYLSAIESSNDTTDLRAAVYNLLSSNDQALNDLKTAFGVDINNLNADTLSGLDSLADALHVDTATLAAQLGADANALGDLISSTINSQSVSLPADIRSGLQPYLTAIEDANDTTSLQSAVVGLQSHVDSLPPGIKAQLNAQLQGIVGNTNGLIAAVGDIDNQMLVKLDSLADSFGVDISTLASALGLNIDTMGDLIATTIENSPGGDNDTLIPYLQAIENANDDTALRSALGAIEFAVNGVPGNIQNQLSNQLNGIIDSNSPAQTVGAVNALQSYINSLPAGIKSQLNSQLSGILTGTNNTKVATDAVKAQAQLINNSVGGLPPNIKAQLNAQLNNIVGYTGQTKNAVDAVTSASNGTTGAVNSSIGAINNVRGAAIDTKNEARSIKDSATHLWYIRQNLVAQNNNWSRSGSANIPSYAVGTDFAGSDRLSGSRSTAIPAILHGGEMVFDYAQSGSLRDKVLANMSIVPAAMAMLKRAANEPKFVKQEISIAPQKVTGGSNDEVVKELRSIKSELTEAKRELKELKDNQKRTQANIETGINTIAETMEDWDGNGVPVEAAA